MRNLEVVRGIYRAMAQGDVSAMFERFAPDCVVAQDPRLPWGGRWQGHDGLVEFALPLVGLIDSQVHTDAIYESDDEHVVEFGHTVGATREHGTPFDVHQMGLLQVWLTSLTPDVLGREGCPHAQEVPRGVQA